MSNVLVGKAFTRKYIISFLTLTLGQGQTRNFSQYALHNMTYTPAKFEAAMSNGLGGNEFTRNTVSHFNNAPLIKCKIIQKRNRIFLI